MSEPPAKRLRLSLSTQYDNVQDIEEIQRRSNLKLKHSFQSIFDKYGAATENDGDLIDLGAETVVEDNGHLRHMRHEHDVGRLQPGLLRHSLRTQSRGHAGTSDDELGTSSSSSYSDEDSGLQPPIVESSVHQANTGRPTTAPGSIPAPLAANVLQSFGNQLRNVDVKDAAVINSLGNTIATALVGWLGQLQTDNPSPSMTADSVRREMPPVTSDPQTETSYDEQVTGGQGHVDEEPDDSIASDSESDQSAAEEEGPIAVNSGDRIYRNIRFAPIMTNTQSYAVQKNFIKRTKPLRKVKAFSSIWKDDSAPKRKYTFIRRKRRQEPTTPTKPRRLAEADDSPSDEGIETSDPTALPGSGLEELSSDEWHARGSAETNGHLNVENTSKRQSFPRSCRATDNYFSLPDIEQYLEPEPNESPSPRREHTVQDDTAQDLDFSDDSDGIIAHDEKLPQQGKTIIADSESGLSGVLCSDPAQSKSQGSHILPLLNEIATGKEDHMASSIYGPSSTQALLQQSTTRVPLPTGAKQPLWDHMPLAESPACSSNLPQPSIVVNIPEPAQTREGWHVNKRPRSSLEPSSEASHDHLPKRRGRPSKSRPSLEAYSSASANLFNSQPSPAAEFLIPSTSLRPESPGSAPTRMSPQTSSLNVAEQIACKLPQTMRSETHNGDNAPQTPLTTVDAALQTNPSLVPTTSTSQTARDVTKMSSAPDKTIPKRSTASPRPAPPNVFPNDPDKAAYQGIPTTYKSPNRIASNKSTSGPDTASTGKRRRGRPRKHAEETPSKSIPIRQSTSNTTHSASSTPVIRMNDLSDDDLA